MKFFFAVLIATILLSFSCSPKKEQIISFDKPQTVIVVGKIINPIAEENSIRLAINRIGMNQEALDVEVDSNGSFRFEFEAYVPADAWLGYQTNFLVLFHPGDSIYVEFKGDTEETEQLLTSVKFGGDAAELNRGVAAFQKVYYGSALYNSYELKEAAIKKYEPEQFKVFADSFRDVGKKLYDDFIKKESLNEEAKLWATQFLTHDYQNDLYFYPLSHRKLLVLKQSEWSVPVTFYDFLKGEEITEQSLIGAYAVSSYAGKYMYGPIRALAQNEIDKALAEGLITKAESEKYSVLDSVMIQTLLEQPVSPLLKEMAFTSLMSNLLDESDIEGFERQQKLADQYIVSPFLKDPLLKKYQVEKAKQNQQLNPSALISTQSYEGDPIALIRKENKGKVIFIDIWATWCGPCREEFPYSKKLEEKLNHEVVFAYVCIDSERHAYLNALKKYQLGGVHYFLEKDESDQLRDHYDLDGIPHYLLLDKNGNVAGEGYKIRPSDDTTYGKIKSVLGSNIE